MISDEILSQFGIDGKARVSELVSGHINSTCLAQCNDGSRYIVQALNTRIFRNPDAVMKNISAVEKAFSRKDITDEVTVPHYLTTVEGDNYIENDGEIFRAYTYTEPLDLPRDRYFRAGYAFGAFINTVNRKGVKFEVTIENFHSFDDYFSSLIAADKNSPLKKIDKIIMRRLSSLRDTIAQVFTVDFPKKNVHNDAKISNVVFGEKCTVIDLDTVMSGYAAIDYGDLIRSVCTSENTDLAVIRDVSRGFARGIDGILSDDEIYSLYYGILYVTGELAVRYLIDYLSDVKYFRDKTSAECLSRANELLKQLNKFISDGDEITSIIYKAFKKQ